MNQYSREVERKFILGGGASYESAHRLLVGLVDRYPLDQSSVDRFWVHPTVDFVRMRENSRELTVKVTDRGSTVDRIEENAVFEGSIDFTAGVRLLTLLFGEPCLVQRKTFSVFYASDVVVCLYQVEGDPLRRVFLEVEAEPDHGTILNVDAWVDRLRSHGLELQPELRSLFQIFYQGGVK